MSTPVERSVPENDNRAAMSELSERVKELECLYRVASIFADRRGPVSECLRGVVSVLRAACRFPERAVAELTLDSITHTCPSDSPGAVGPRVDAPLRIAGLERGRISLSYRDMRAIRNTALEESCELFIVEERAMLNAVADQVGVFIAGVESEHRRREMEATLWHADRLATIGQLAAGVAHEINEPVGNMLGFAQLALKTPDLPRQVQTDLGHIVDAALRGREIIRKLLLYARQTPASKRPIAINDVVEEAMFLLEAGCERSGIRYIREYAHALPEITADPLQIRQVITNLVINATQAIENSGMIIVRTESTRPDTVELSVSDTGAGMTPNVKQRAFDPFFTTKDIGQGTGLGLSIVQGIVAEHGGTVEVESEPERGSVFRVRLPVNGSIRQPSGSGSE
ncbi:MAG: hypothetical protein KDA16_09025 [Phycisphaerales bacterium]|nr:hypothetical protein [Phycisphaerales bacterium]